MTGSRLARWGLVLAAVTATVVGLAAPVQAFPQASFHTLSTGNRGVDVLAAQYLLQARNVSVAADGVFGSGTAAAVRGFQAANGLGQDGVIGAQTWGALVQTVRQGSTGPAVRAVQVELNEKRRLGLAVDGMFDRHRRRGAVVPEPRRDRGGRRGRRDDVAEPDVALRLPVVWPAMCDQDPDGNGAANWGTGSSVGQLEAAYPVVHRQRARSRWATRLRARRGHPRPRAATSSASTSTFGRSGRTAPSARRAGSPGSPPPTTGPRLARSSRRSAATASGHVRWSSSTTRR